MHVFENDTLEQRRSEERSIASALANADRPLSAAPFEQSMPRAIDDDEAIQAAARRWLELQSEVVGLRRKRDQLRMGPLARFEDLHCFDPRGVSEKAVGSLTGIAARLATYEPAYIESGAGEIEDRIVAIFDEQHELERRLLIDGPAPNTIAGAVAIARVCAAWLEFAADIPEEEGHDGATVARRGRAMLKAIAAISADPAQDADILALCAEWRCQMEAANAPGATDTVIERILDIEHKLRDSPARSREGVRRKLALAADEFRQIEGEERGSNRLLLSAVEDALSYLGQCRCESGPPWGELGTIRRRIALGLLEPDEQSAARSALREHAENDVAEDPLVGLADDYSRLIAELAVPRGRSDEEIKPLLDRLSAVERRIVETPAMSLAGLVAKCRCADHIFRSSLPPDHQPCYDDERGVLAALADTIRLLS